MKICNALFAAIAAAGVSGCATIFDGRDQAITFMSVPEQADLVIKNRAGQRIHSGETPVTITLNRGAGYFKSEKYTVTISKAGYQPQDIAIEGKVNGWYVANILFGGIIGLLIVDPVTGAMYDLTPEKVDAALQANGVTFRDGERVLTVMLAEDVPEALWASARRLPSH